jgi:hypothetical protein
MHLIMENNGGKYYPFDCVYEMRIVLVSFVSTQETKGKIVFAPTIFHNFPAASISSLLHHSSLAPN